MQLSEEYFLLNFQYNPYNSTSKYRLFQLFKIYRNQTSGLFTYAIIDENI